MDVKKHEEGWALDTHPSYSPIFILTQWQKEGFSHQLHSESEAVGEGVALGNAVHLVHFAQGEQAPLLFYGRKTRFCFPPPKKTPRAMLAPDASVGDAKN